LAFRGWTVLYLAMPGTPGSILNFGSFGSTLADLAKCGSSEVATCLTTTRLQLGCGAH